MKLGSIARFTDRGGSAVVVMMMIDLNCELLRGESICQQIFEPLAFRPGTDQYIK
jgi:hypothetical protein